VAVHPRVGQSRCRSRAAARCIRRSALATLGGAA
jgi:hypothetical protein